MNTEDKKEIRKEKKEVKANYNKRLGNHLKMIRWDYDDRKKAIAKKSREEYERCTQEVAAKGIGISLYMYRRLEAGKKELTADLIPEICKYFEISADYLLMMTKVPVHPDNPYFKSIERSNEFAKQIMFIQDKVVEGYLKKIDAAATELNKQVELLEDTFERKTQNWKNIFLREFQEDLDKAFYLKNRIGKLD